MKEGTKIIVIASAISIFLVFMLEVPTFGARTITYDSSTDVKEEYLFEALTDLKNYHQVFPDYIKSVDLTHNDLGNFAHLIGSVYAFGFDSKIVYTIDRTGTFYADIVSGDYSGTKATAILTKIFSNDGKNHEEGTKIHVELRLDNGFFSPISFVGDDSIKSGLNIAFGKFIVRAKALQLGSS